MLSIPDCTIIFAMKPITQDDKEIFKTTIEYITNTFDVKIMVIQTGHESLESRIMDKKNGYRIDFYYFDYFPETNVAYNYNYLVTSVLYLVKTKYILLKLQIKKKIFLIYNS